MPARKIVNDIKLEELFKQGKSLKEIGRELGVSHVAVFKRVKRLGLVRLPESLENLTDKQRAFVVAVASGQSRTSAVMQTYDVTTRESAKALQKTLMKDPAIATAITDLMESKGIGRDYRVEKLKEHLDSKDPVISLKSLDMAFKISGDEDAAKRNAQEEYTFLKIDLEATNKWHAEYYRCRGCEHCENCEKELKWPEGCNHRETGSRG
jgi:hypothetical protein